MWLDLLLIVVVALCAGVLSAVVGFGGAALLLPVLVAVFGVREAIPILAIAQLLGNGSRVVFNWREVAMPVVGWFTLGAVPLALIGSVIFVTTPREALTRLLGAFLILLVAWRHFRPAPPRSFPVYRFAVVGAVFSFLSSLLGTAGPISAPFFLAYGLVKGAYIGTEALASAISHVFKLFVYGGAALLSGANVGMGMAIGAVLTLGSFTGKRVVDRLPTRVFVLIVEVALVVAGFVFLLSP
jgi:uncharacterized membrane protein YfcA